MNTVAAVAKVPTATIERVLHTRLLRMTQSAVLSTRARSSMAPQHLIKPREFRACCARDAETRQEQHSQPCQLGPRPTRRWNHPYSGSSAACIMTARRPAPSTRPAHRAAPPQSEGPLCPSRSSLRRISRRGRNRLWARIPLGSSTSPIPLGPASPAVCPAARPPSR
jgi:hypothetical protein